LIAGNAFADCSQLTAVHFSAASPLRAIDRWAFCATGLSEITIPANVTAIGDGAFGNCQKLARVEFPDNSAVERIGSEAFRRTALERFFAPPLLARLGRSAFAYCGSLTTAVLSPALTVVKQDTFSECKELASGRTPVAAGRVIVEPLAFPERFERAQFTHGPDVEVVWVEPGWRRRDPAPPSKPSGPVYEKAKPPGTPTYEYILDSAERVQVPGGPAVRSGSGRGFLARHKTSGELSWVKTFNEEHADVFFKQSDLFAQLVHPALLGMIGMALAEGETDAFLVTEYMKNGSLEDLIKDTDRYAALSGTVKAKIAVGIVLGMKYIHGFNLIHRDLKSANVLLDENYEPRIADYRTARMVDLLSMTTAGNLGTSHFFQAPELHGETYDQKVDVFAFGMMFWEIVMGRPVVSGFPGGTTRLPMVHLRKVGEGERPSTTELSPDAESICDVTWQQDPEERDTFAGVLDYLKNNAYAILPDVDGDEVAGYVARIENYEGHYPPVPLDGNDAQ
jgi:hypothetical protein